MIKRILTLVVIMFFIVTCQSHKKDKDGEFENIKLRGELLSISSDDLQDPVALEIIDTLLIVKNSAFAEFQYTIIDLKTNKVLQHFGVSGRGPGEQVSNYMFTKSKVPRCFEAYSINSLQYQRFNVDSVLNGSKQIYETIATFKANKDKHDLMNFFWPVNARAINDNLFVTRDFYEDNVFGLCDNQGNLLGTYLSYPDAKELPLPLNKMKVSVFQGEIKVHPTDDRFVYACSQSDWLMICEVTEGGIKELFNGHSYLPNYYIIDGRELKRERNSKIGYFNLVTSKDFIYIQISDKTINESIKGNRIDLRSNLIYLYDWSGNKKYRLQLDQEVLAYTIHENEKALYAISNIPEPVIYKYKLKRIL